MRHEIIISSVNIINDLGFVMEMQCDIYWEESFIL